MPEDKSAEIKDKISRALNEAGLADQHQRLNTDETTRLARKYTPMVMTLEFGEKDDIDPMVAPLPGTVVLFTAKKGSRLLRSLESAYANRSISRLNQLGAELRAIVEKREVISVREVVDKLIDAPVYFDIRYGSKTLAQNLGLVNDIEFGSVTFAYNGGQLRDEDFKVVEYYRPGAREELDHLVVKNPPRLTDLEREVLSAVPEDMSELNIAIASKCRGWTVALVVVFVVLTAVGSACVAVRDRLAQLSLSPEQLQRLGSLGSARELLNMRRRILEDGI
jgi:hypothetical protein